MTSGSFSQTAAFLWSVADLLRGDFKQSQYGRIILPFTLLRRLECVLESSKPSVLAQVEKIQSMNLPEEAQEKMILRAADNLTFFNTSPMDLSKMGQNGIKANLEKYVQSFSTDAREIFDHFKFSEFVGQLEDANLLYKVVQKFAATDLSPEAISNHEMGFVFEELIRRFAESSNETAGEHFTPRDIVRLTTSLVFMEDDDALTKDGIIRTIYDPTAGTGGFLSSGMEYLHELNPNAVMRAFGQELNPESYAICKADMLIKGQDVSRIKLGNTLSNDQLPADRFDYMLSNPPFGVDWKKIEGEINDEHLQKGFSGRFGPGLPRVSDGSLLFLLHLIGKMRDAQNGGGRIGIILNGSPLFTGGAGSGESEIRRYILEADLLEGIIALPTDMFYNTGIATYIWILSNKKIAERKGKVQLIDGSNLCDKMRKSLGSKRHQMGDEDIRLITRTFGDIESVSATTLDVLGLEKAPEQKSSRGRQSATAKSEAPKTFASKIFNNTDFGYRRLTIERPLRLSAQISDEAIATLRFAPKPFNAPMERLYEVFASQWRDENYGDFTTLATEARAIIKAEFAELKEKQIKDLFDSKLWQFQRELMEKARRIQAAVGAQAGGKEVISNDFNQFQLTLKGALNTAGVKLDAKENKQLIDAITRKNPNAEPVVKKVLKEAAQPLYGAFDYQGKVVEFEQDGDLRDNENVPLNPAISSSELIESYFKAEVLPHVADAWINADKRDAKDGDIGIIGYEIPFNRHFYIYQPPRPLEEIDADLDAISIEIMQLLKRQTEISHVVTKGLNPNVPMKDSGVEWVDSIPSHWEVMPTFSVCEASMKKNYDGIESNVLSLSYGKIIPRNVDTNYGLLPESFNTYQIVECRDIILRLTDLQNDKNSLRVGLVKQKGIITSAYLKLKSKSRISPDFLYQLLHSYDTTKVFYGMGGGLRQSMKFEDFRRLPLLLPPTNEQKKIAVFLDQETTKIDNLLEKQQQIIQLLQERRTALISAAVTGKIDVRNWVAPGEQAKAESPAEAFA
ncbi:type I restriction enzyme M protein [Citrobacter sp. 506]